MGREFIKTVSSIFESAYPARMIPSLFSSDRYASHANSLLSLKNKTKQSVQTKGHPDKQTNKQTAPPKKIAHGRGLTPFLKEIAYGGG